jgi:hypothetical protein
MPGIIAIFIWDVSKNDLSVGSSLSAAVLGPFALKHLRWAVQT